MLSILSAGAWRPLPFDNTVTDLFASDAEQVSAVRDARMLLVLPKGQTPQA
jgi:hypothetical protein